MSDVLYILRVIVPEWRSKQLRLKKRRNNSWKSYLNLTVRFHQIGKGR